MTISKMKFSPDTGPVHWVCVVLEEVGGGRLWHYVCGPCVLAQRGDQGLKECGPKGHTVQGAVIYRGWANMPSGASVHAHPS